MKKIVCLAIVVVLATSLCLGLSACGGTDGETVSAVVAVPDGAPALSFAEVLTDGYTAHGVKTEVELVLSSAGAEAPSIVGSKLLGGTCDMAILPTNVAAKLYNGGLDIKIVSTNIWGNLYMLSKSDAVTDLHSLIGKTVYNLSEGGTPDVLFKYFLEEAGIAYATPDDNDVSGKVILDYKPAGILISGLKENTIEYAVFGEPAVGKAIAAVGAACKTVFDYQSYWASVSGSESSYPQASLVVKGSFLNAHKDFVDALSARLASVNIWLEVEGNIDRAKTAYVAAAEATTLASINAATVSRSGLSSVGGKEAKPMIESYLTVLGMPLPSDGFYYDKDAK